MTHILRLLQSRKLALFLLIVITGISIISVFGDQSVSARIYSSWWFPGIGAALCLNVSFCTFNRIKALLRGTKNPLAFSGSIAFHFSFLIIIAGVIYNQAARSYGEVVITEGQTVVDREENYLGIIKARFAPVDQACFAVRLDNIDLSYHKGRTLSSVSGDITIFDFLSGSNRQETIRVNYPIYHAGKKILLREYGFSPLFILTNDQGERLWDSFINLDIIKEGGSKEDLFFIKDFGLTVKVKFYPDMHVVNGKMTAESYEMKNPIFYLTISKSSGNLFKGKVPLGGPVAFDKLRLSIPNIRYWGKFQVVVDSGVHIIFFAFWTGIAGLILRFIPLLIHSNREK